MKTAPWLSQFRANFLTGLAVLFPALLSLFLFFWLFGTLSNFTDKLLFFVPERITHAEGGAGETLWYWKLAALAFGAFLVALMGRMTRHYIGKKFLQITETLLMQVPLLNKIYGAIKQIKDAFTAGGKSAFRQVVLVQYPRAGLYTIGFITGEQHHEVQAKTSERVVAIFVPTTPNPTSGFIVLAPERDVIRLDMSVADGIKFVVSLGSVSPEYGQPALLTPHGPVVVTQPTNAA